jgi:hypothetical protein
MKTGTRNLVIVASCIVVLGGAAAALTLTGGGNGKSSSSSSSAPTIDLVSKKSEDIVSMSVKNKKGSYTLIPVVKTVVPSASSGASSSTSGVAETDYTIKGLEDAPVDYTAAAQVIQDGFSLVATQNLGTVSNPQEFGLTDPQATVEVSFKDGSSYNYKIGNALPTDSSSYYMSGEDSNNVYVVSVDSGILEDANYFIKKELLNIQSSTGENDFTTITLSGKNYPQPIVFKKTGTTEEMVFPIKADPDINNYGTLKTALTSLAATSVVKTNPTAADLKAYGLDQPAAIAEFTVNSASYKVLLGAKKDSGYYAMLDKVNVVYEVSADSVSAWAQASTFSLRSKIIYLPNITTVKSIAVTRNGTKTALNVARTKDESKSTQDQPEYTYKVTSSGGKAVDYDNAYKTFYQNLIGMELLEQASTKPAGQPDYTIEYQYFDQSTIDKIEFYKNGDRRYTAVFNGQVEGNVTSPDLDKIVYDFQQLAG